MKQCRRVHENESEDELVTSRCRCRVAVMARMRKAAELRSNGVSGERIAKIMGYHPSTVAHWFGEGKPVKWKRWQA